MVCYASGVFEIHPSRIFLWSCLALLGGVLAASVISLGYDISVGFLLLGLVLLVTFFFSSRKSALVSQRIALAGLLVVFFVVGLLRVFIADLPPQGRIPLSALWGEKIATRGIVTRDPDFRIDQIRLVVDAQEAAAVETKSIKTSGRLLVFLNTRFFEYRYGDTLFIKGKVVKPEPIGAFNWPAFLAKDGITAVMYNPTIELEARNKGNAFLGGLYKLKSELRESLYRALPPKHAAIVMAVLTGDEGGMSDDFQQALNRSGLRHIVAVSGMNITLVGGLTMAGLLGVGLWRQHAFWGALLVVALFVLFVGAPPSAVRAGMMGGILLLAQRAGRTNNAATSVVGAGAFMVFVQPHALRWDTGFQLSFLAVLGILYFGEYFKGKFTFAPDIFQLRDALAMTVAAQLATIPFLLATFSQISLVGILANILVVPLLAFMTILGFGLGLLGILLPQGAFLFGLPLLPFASWISVVAEHGSRFPVMRFSLAGAMAWVAVGIYYTLLLAFFRRVQKAKKWPIQFLNESLSSKS